MNRSYVALSLVLLAACSSPQGDTSSAALESGESADELSTGGSSKECVIDTVTVAPGLLTDLKAALGTSYFKDYGGQYYPHLEVPGVFDAAIASDGIGEWFYTVVGMSYHPEELSDGSTTARRMATLEASTVRESSLKTAKKNFRAAKALFDAMTRANESVENHVVVQPAYDRSYVKTTRSSPAKRVVCTSTTYPDQNGHVEYACTFADVERNRVQIFDVDSAGGKCLPK